MQTLTDEPQQRPVGDPSLEHLAQFGAIQTVEEGRDVRLQKEVHFASVDEVLQHADGLVGTATWPEAIGAVQEVLLVERSEHFAKRPLHDLVLKARDADRTSLAASLF